MILVTLCGTARADLRNLRPSGGAWLHYELAGVQRYEERAMAAPRAKDLVLAGARLHGFFGGKHLAYHAGLDLAAGGTARGGGFAYDVALMPIGAGLRLGSTGILAIGTGVGAMGATSTIPGAATFPLEANLEVGGGVRLLARARATWVARHSREGGAVSTGAADELDATLGLRIGHHYEDYDFPSGNGYFAGVAYRELMGARFVGVVIGYSVDLASPQRW